MAGTPRAKRGRSFSPRERWQTNTEIKGILITSRGSCPLGLVAMGLTPWAGSLVVLLRRWVRRKSSTSIGALVPQGHSASIRSAIPALSWLTHACTPGNRCSKRANCKMLLPGLAEHFPCRPLSRGGLGDNDSIKLEKRTDHTAEASGPPTPSCNVCLFPTRP